MGYSNTQVTVCYEYETWLLYYLIFCFSKLQYLNWGEGISDRIARLSDTILSDFFFSSSSIQQHRIYFTHYPISPSYCKLLVNLYTLFSYPTLILFYQPDILQGSFYHSNFCHPILLLPKSITLDFQILFQILFHIQWLVGFNPLHPTDMAHYPTVAR